MSACSPETCHLHAVIVIDDGKAGHRCRAFLFLSSTERLDLEIHTTHAAHAAATRRHAAACVLLRYFGHHGFGGDQESRNGGRVLDRYANYLGRVDDALGDKVAVFAGLRVEGVGILIFLEDLADDDRAVFTCIDGDLAGRIGQRLADDLDTGLLVVVLGAGTMPSSTAARVACIASSTRSLRSLTSTSSRRRRGSPRRHQTSAVGNVERRLVLGPGCGLQKP